MIRTSIKDLIEILSAKTTNDCDINKIIEGVSIDSRNVSKNNLFIPIKGSNSNGHDFVLRAIENGASATLWNKDESNPPENINVIFVDDTIESMQKLARLYRKNLKAKFIGITGSNGKTSTKDITAAILSQKFYTQKTLGNYNTEIGVPYTLLNLDDKCEVVVVEMGMEFAGEIDYLTNLVKPHIGIITSVGLVHIYHFDSIEGIAKAKLEIVNGIQENGLFIYFGDDKLIQDTAKNTNMKESIRIKTFGENSNNDLYIKSVTQSIDKISFTINDNTEEFNADILGKHQAFNTLAAILAARELGMSYDEIRKGLEKIDKTGLRNEIVKIKNCTILNDCYKSNPVSINAALDILDLFSTEKKIVVLGDIYGLRELSEDIHFEVGKNLSNHKIDELITIGEMSKDIARGARENKSVENIVEFLSKDLLIDYLSKYIDEKCTILIKGSRFLELEDIANKLKTL